MAEWVEVHLPCPSCNSSDAYAVNADGWGTCFSCDVRIPPEGGGGNREEVEMEIEAEGFEIIPTRGISETAYKKFNVNTSIVDGKPNEVGFTYPNGSTKVRNFNEKKFRTIGNFKGATLFGKDKFEKGGKVITIVEGEYDALAFWDMSNTPVVSVPSSTQGKRACKEEWDYLNSFDKIVLCMDSDAPGQACSAAVASLFDFNKVYRVEMERKDANEYLENKEINVFLETWKNCKKYTPDNIISTFDDISKVLKKKKEERLCTYPFKGLQDKLYGMYGGEVIVFKGNEGIGKTEIFRALEHHILKTTDKRIGIIHLEEDQQTTIKAIATYESKYPYVHLQDNSSEEQVLKDYKKAVSNDPDRCYIYSSFDVEDEEKLIDNVRFLVSACGVSFIFLDHITWLATGMEGEDERRKLDRISQRIKLLAKELGFTFIMISHTNDDGKSRGSRNITKVANTVIHMSRDVTSVIDEERLRTYFMIEKGRGGGVQSGAGGWATFHPESLTLIDIQESKELPNE